MRSSGSSASIALLLLLAMTPMAVAATGTTSNEVSYEIRLLERQWTPDAGLSPIERTTLEQRAAALRLEGEERIHVLLQLRRPRELADREALGRRGIELGSYVPHSAWIASVPADRVLELAGSDEVRWMTHWDAGYKLHPRIEAGDWGSWAIDPSREGWAWAFVQLHRDVPLDRVEELAVAVGGEASTPVVGVHGALVLLPMDQIGALAAEEDVLWIEQAPPPLSATNDGVLTAMRADILQSAPYGLEGEGVRLFVYDGGAVRSTHTTFDSGSGSRVNVIDDSEVRDHATHVAGTAAGDGNGGQGKGVAPEATILSAGFEPDTEPGEVIFYDVAGDIEEDYVTATSPSREADLGNNSVGSNLANNGFLCDLEGNYGISSQLLDGIVRGDNGSINRPVMMAWSNGNERTGGPPPGRCGSNYATTPPPSCAKNPIHVGAINSDGGSMTKFSSWGPCDDGRLKPIVVAPGCEAGFSTGEDFVFSSLAASDSTFGGPGWCGTSMASPAVAGVMTLFLQDWRALGHGGPTDRPLPALVKTMLIQTARDVGQPGPDYIYGYGAVDAVRLIDLLRDGGPLNGTGPSAWGEESVGQGGMDTYTFVVPPGTRELKASLAWDDQAAALFVGNALVNDLDLEVQAPDGTLHSPWTLDRDSPHAPATTGVNELDNQEQVVVALPEAGVWTIRVRGTFVPGGSQSYGLAYGAELLTFDPSGCEDRISNGDFEETTVPWTLSGAQRVPSPSPGHGSFSLQLGGVVDSVHLARIAVDVPAGSLPVDASFWWYMATEEGGATGNGFDDFVVLVLDSAGTPLATLDFRSDGWPQGEWMEVKGLDLSSWAGETIHLAFLAGNTQERPTTFFIDDVQVDACPETRTLTLEKTGTGSGTVTSNPPGIDCGTDCTESYPFGTEVTLTATPAPGSTFAGWSGACSGTGLCQVTMDDHRTVTATFLADTRTLTVENAGSGSGTVTSNPPGIDCGADCAESYAFGTVVALTAVPAAGSTFTGWTGDPDCIPNGVVTMDADKTCIATFDLSVPPIVLLVDDDDNEPDVRSYYTIALDALGVSYAIWDTENGDDEPGTADLASYETVMWFTGHEFGGFAGPGPAGEASLSAWLSGGGCLLLSSQDYHFDRGLTSFMASFLGVSSATNDVGQTAVTGAGSAMSGLGPYSLAYPFANFSDELSPAGSAEVAFTGDQGDAAVSKDAGAYRTVFLGFPFEALPQPADRQEVLGRMLVFCDEGGSGNLIFEDGFESGDLSAWSNAAP